MYLTTISTEFDTYYFLGEENPEILDCIYDLEYCEIPYIKNSRNVEFELIIENYDINEEMKFFYYETLDEALAEFNDKVRVFGNDDVNIFLTHIETSEVVKCVENFIA